MNAEQDPSGVPTTNPVDREEQSILPTGEKKSLPSPQAFNKGGFMNGGAFLTTLFLVAFFSVSFSLGIYVERTNKLQSGVEKLIAQAGGGSAQAAAPGQVLGLEDGEKVADKIEADKSRTKGNENAKVTIFEYSDFECPFCQKFYQEAYQDILKKYVDTGKVKIVFKDFPLAFHENAQSAHEASRCAAEQGKFWEMHDRLFANQQTLSVDNYKKWASELGMNSYQFNQCVDTKKYAKAVQDDLNEGVKIGVQGTPSFVVNGIALVGAQPISAFDRVIESELNK